MLTCLPQLEELSWSLAGFRSAVKGKQYSFERIKKVYIESYIHGGAGYHLELLYVLSWFVNLECLQLHFSTVHNTVVHNLSNVFLPPKFQKLHSLICTSDSFNMLETIPNAECFLTVEKIVMTRGLDRPWKNVWILNSILGMDLSDFLEKKTQVIAMKGATIKNVKQQPIIEAGGPKVKIFQLDSCQFESDVDQDAILRGCFSVSQNITELNLFNTHFSPLFFPCVPISTLHSLKKLLLPICCIYTTDAEISSFDSGYSTSTASVWPFPSSKRVSRVNPHFYDVPVPLNLIVEGCQQLTELDIRQFPKDTLCSVCRGSTRWNHPEDSLVPIHRMRNLQTLTLVGVQANCIQRGKFLEAFHDRKNDFPNKLTTLRFYFIGLQGHQTYWKSLSSALPTFTHLRDISLQHSTLSLDSKDFWNVFNQIKELERLCLVSNFSGQLPLPLLREFILQVPKLYVFHVHSRARNFKSTLVTLRRFSDGTGQTGVIRNSMEIVIQHFPRHVDLSSCDKVRHEGKFIHMEKLCVPGTDIAQVRRKCGLQPVL